GYVLLVGLTAGCAWKLRRTPQPVSVVAPPSRGWDPETPPGRPWHTRFRWLALAFVPSSLLLSVTQFITTDIAPVPGLWVLPLAVYLVTFIVAFGRTPRPVRQAVEVVTPVAVLLLLWTLITDKRPESLGVVLGMHLLVF